MTLAKTVTGSALLQVADSKPEAIAKLPRRLTCSALAFLWATTALAQTLPTGGTVSSGSATITQPGGNQLTINQNSNTAIINWNGFSIGSGAQVNFNQPNGQSVVLNRVTGSTGTEIYGQLNANGQVHLVNPNGIFIGPSGHISTGGFVASTLDISDDDFLNGTYRYQGNGNSQGVENAGTITVAPGGYAALIGGRVSNSGLIRVPLGRVGLGAGEQVTLDVSGDGFLQVAVPSDSDDATMEALISNSGRIEAEGGLVHLKAASARNAARQVINMSGVIEARSVSGSSGAVVLGGGGGAVHISGVIDTSASVASVSTSPRPVARPTDGGDITVTGESIALAGATLKADGAGSGDGGNIRVGGDYQGGGDLPTARFTSVDAKSTLSANGGDTGNGGRIIVWSDELTTFAGVNSARGGDSSGDGGFVEVSGKIDLRYSGVTDTRAPNGVAGTLLLDPTDILVSNNPSTATVTVGTIQTNLALGNVILDTSGTGSLTTQGGTTDLGGSNTDPGDITIADAIIWNSTFDLILNADNNIAINAAINAPNGGLVLNAPGLITTGAGGDVNVASFSLLSGSWQQVSGNLPAFFAGDFSIAPSANFLRALGGDGSAANPYQLTDIYGVQGIGSPALSGQNFELANNIDASVTSGWTNGFNPISSFDGTLDGNRNVIDGLFIDQGTNSGGFVDVNDGVLTEFQLTNADVTVGSGGIVANINFGEISGVAVSGSIFANAGGGGGSTVGGLVGTNFSTIVDSFSVVDVDAILPAGASFGFVFAGGLAGVNEGVITRSHSLGDVGLVNQAGIGELVGGGLTALNLGTIRDSYARGDITAQGGTGRVTLGGLTGTNGDGAIINSFSTGAPVSTGSGLTELGGLIGNGARIPIPGADVDIQGSVTASFWDVNTSGLNNSAGGTALTTAQFQNTAGFFNLASAQGWDFMNVWAPGSSGFFPANYTTSPVVFAIPNNTTAIEGQTAAATTTGTVAGGPSVFRFGPDPDTLDTSPIFGNLAFASQNPGATTFTVNTGNLTSAGGQVFRVVALPGNAVIQPAGGGGPGTPVIPPTPVVEIPPTVDTTIDDTPGGGTTVITVDDADGTLTTIENLSDNFDDAISSCASEGDDVNKYLACLAEAMDDFAQDLDKIAGDLPPGLE
ncbi:MAG: filamentous hemagglutinin N-terminal domain-containing protein, partial [Ruegeria sp.]